MDITAAPSLGQLTAVIAAVGALGTAAFGLVDTFKELPGGGISRAGFKFIRQAALKFAPPISSSGETGPGRLPSSGTPGPTDFKASGGAGTSQVLSSGETGLSMDSVLYTLRSQWINGTATADQVSIAKSLIKLRLNQDTAEGMARATGVDADVLSDVAKKIHSGESLSQQESDVYGRFDLLLTTLLDQAYQRADQRYRNVAKVAAIPVSVALALIAAKVAPNEISYARAILVGLIATPIAPIAKDISTAISTGAQAIQSWKG